MENVLRVVPSLSFDEPFDVTTIALRRTVRIAPSKEVGDIHQEAPSRQRP